MAEGRYKEWLEPDGILRLEAWARDGLTLAQIAHNCGVGLTTLKRWRDDHEEIRTALKRGKEVVDIEVENALHKKAMGYTVNVSKVFKVKHIDYNEATGRKIREYETLETREEEIHIPADTIAQIFWLKNRKPDEWREKRQEPENPDDKTVRVVFEGGGMDGLGG